MTLDEARRIARERVLERTRERAEQLRRDAVDRHEDGSDRLGNVRAAMIARNMQRRQRIAQRLAERRRRRNNTNTTQDFRRGQTSARRLDRA